MPAELSATLDHTQLRGHTDARAARQRMPRGQDGRHQRDTHTDYDSREPESTELDGTGNKR